MRDMNETRNEGVEKIAVCPYCGERWNENDKYCSNCGAKKDRSRYINDDLLSSLEYRKMHDTRIRGGNAMRNMGEMWDEDMKKIAVCPDCGKTWIEDDKYCRYCGAKKDKPKYIYDDFACIYGPEPVNRTHKCEKCGYEWTTCLMDDREAFCPKCGGNAPSREERVPRKRFY